MTIEPPECEVELWKKKKKKRKKEVRIAEGTKVVGANSASVYNRPHVTRTTIGPRCIMNREAMRAQRASCGFSDIAQTRRARSRDMRDRIDHAQRWQESLAHGIRFALLSDWVHSPFWPHQHNLVATTDSEKENVLLFHHANDTMNRNFASVSPPKDLHR